MIQRIQSIYLLAAAAALALQFALPYATAPADSLAATAAIFADGKFSPTDNTGLLVLSVLGIGLALVAIFWFKNRSSQIKIAGLCTTSAILTAVLAVFACLNLGKNLPEGSVVSYGAGGALPMLAAIFSWLAQRAIGADEAKVRSMDRLR